MPENSNDVGSWIADLKLPNCRSGDFRQKRRMACKTVRDKSLRYL